MPCSAQDLGDQPHCRGLAVGSGHANDLELASGMVVPSGVEVGQGLTSVADDGRGHALQFGQRSLDDKGHSTRRKSGGPIVVAVD